MRIDWLDGAVHDWRRALAESHREGRTVLRWLTASDLGPDQHPRLTIMALVEAPGFGSGREQGAGRFVRTRLNPGDSLPTVSDLFPAAEWHERETAELFGVEFTGHSDPRPLFSNQLPDQLPPLLRSTPLERRVSRPWPGHHEPSGRPARDRPNPGVEPDWVAGS